MVAEKSGPGVNNSTKPREIKVNAEIFPVTSYQNPFILCITVDPSDV